MVGEIRDLETADIAIKAAQTGHLVLSTLHTNDAPSAVTRLLNMGVAPFNIASTLNLVIAQRLVRRLCSVCKKPIKLPIAVMLEAGFSDHQIKNSDLYEPVGCASCRLLPARLWDAKREPVVGTRLVAIVAEVCRHNVVLGIV